LQTIGFKEFIPYLEKFDKSHDELINRFVEAPETAEPDGWKALVACLDELKLVTRRYSKRQLKWIRNRFLASQVREIPPVYALDTSDVSCWHQNVYLPAEDVVVSYIADRAIALAPLPKLTKPNEGLNEETSNYCAVCERIFIGEYQWQVHLKSNKHKHKSAGNKKRAKRRKLEEGGGTASPSEEESKNKLPDNNI